MVIRDLEFAGTFSEMSQLPGDGRPEFAFIGRSNVGKSSLINFLFQQKDFAPTSKNPGKTRKGNLYLINRDRYLVDLPGYGYGKVSKKEREGWVRLITDYLRERQTLVNVFILIDPGVDPPHSDLQMMRDMGEMEVPFSIVLTKTDKLRSGVLNKQLQQWKKAILKDWAFLPPIFHTSANKGKGREELWIYMEECLGMTRE